MDNTYDQKSDKQKKLFIDTLENKLRLFQEQRDQMNKQEAEELHQLRETYNDKQHKI